MKNYLIEMSLKPIPKEVYLEKGAAENAYAKKLMDDGIITSFHVSEDHKSYWINFLVDNEESLTRTLQGFPFYPYFDYKVNSVIDMIAAVKTGLTDQ